MFFLFRTVLALVLAAACAGAAAQAGKAQAPAWPSKPIRILLGYPAGTSPDLTMRVVVPALSRVLGQTVIIDPRPGAAGTIANIAVARASDDHTFAYVIAGQLSLPKLLNPKVPYEVGADFNYISQMTSAPLILVSTPDQPGGREFFEAAKQAGGKWNYGSMGVGSSTHIWIELLKNALPAFVPVHIPYNTLQAVVGSMASNQVQMSVMPPSVALPFIRSGKMRAIAVTGPRSPLVPDIPSIQELGIKVFEMQAGTAIVGPANLPRAIVDRMNAALGSVLREEETRQELLKRSQVATHSTPEALRQHTLEEMAQFSIIFSSQGIRVEDLN